MVELNLINAIEIIVSIMFGVLAGLFVVFAFNRIPAEWLCEYDEKPSQELMDPNVKRIKENPWRWVSAVFMASIAVRLICCCESPLNIQLTIIGVFFCWLLIIIGVADKKYMIIPDQFVAFIALSSIGFLPMHRRLIGFTGFMTFDRVESIGSMRNLLIGLVIGGGFMLLVAGIGAVITRKQAIGFGDVKLCASLGIALGISGIIVTLTLGMVASGIYALFILITRKADKNDAIPMGPFLCGGALVYIIIVVPQLLLYN